jgi:hypothetical protein
MILGNFTISYRNSIFLLRDYFLHKTWCFFRACDKSFPSQTFSSLQRTGLAAMRGEKCSESTVECAIDIELQKICQNHINPIFHSVDTQNE